MDNQGGRAAASLPLAQRDERGWVWQIEGDGEARRIAVTITGPAEDSSREDVQAARDTLGRSAVEEVLDRDDPPAWITLTQVGPQEEPYRGGAE